MAALLSFEAVVKVQRKGRDEVAVLDAVSFELEPGEHVGLRGPRRCGKSTLLRIAAGIDRPDAGVVRWDGRSVWELPARERAHRLREIGFAPQSWRTARGKPVIDHVALPLLMDGRSPRAAMSDAHDAIERVGAGEYADAAPHELLPDAMTRVSIARAAIRRPRLLVVDEPGAASSHAERDAVQALLAELSREHAMALLVGARELASLHGADRVMSLGDGRLRVHERPPATVVPFPERAPEPGR